MHAHSETPKNGTLTPSYYTVVQCVPDPLADERINIAIITFNETDFYFQPVESWRRVKQFAGAKTQDAVDFVESLRIALQAQSKQIQQLALLTRLHTWDVRTLQGIIGSWSGSIQFLPTEPAMVGAEELLELMASIYLKEPSVIEPATQHRREIIATAKNLVSEKLDDMLIGRRRADVTLSSPFLAGRMKEAHKFDLAVSRGIPYEISQATSLDVIDLRNVERTIDSNILSFDDLKRRGDYRLANMSYLYRGRTSGSASSQADRLERYIRNACGELSVDVVEVASLPSWAEKAASHLAHAK